MKTHIHRVAGPRKLTYEEFATLLVGIKLVLNSLLLGPVFGDVDDLDLLTPGHLLRAADRLAAACRHSGRPRPSRSLVARPSHKGPLLVTLGLGVSQHASATLGMTRTPRRS